MPSVKYDELIFIRFVRHFHSHFPSTSFNFLSNSSPNSFLKVVPGFLRLRCMIEPVCAERTAQSRLSIQKNPAQSRSQNQFTEINSKFRSCAEHVLEPFPNARNATSKQPFVDVPVAQLARSTPRRMKLFFWPVSLMTRSWPCVLTRCCVVPSRHWQRFDNLKWSSLRPWSQDLSAVLRTLGGWRSSNFSLFIRTFEADLIVQRHVSRSKRILVSHDLKRDSVVSVVPCR